MMLGLTLPACFPHSQSVLLHNHAVFLLTAQRREIGTLPNFQHGISGTLYAEGDRTFVIEGFSYDGNAPAVFVYVFERGASGGLIIQLTGVGTR